MRLYSVWIPGRCPVKKNTQRVVTQGRRRFVVYSPKYTAWEKVALCHMRAVTQSQPIAEPLEAVFRFYFLNHSGEADVSNLIEGPQDALKKAGIIVDDKQIIRVIGEKFFGEQYLPGVEIVLYAWKEIAA